MMRRKPFFSSREFQIPDGQIQVMAFPCLSQAGCTKGKVVQAEASWIVFP